jgi:glycerol-3-phosphate dehydrogenase
MIRSLRTDPRELHRRTFDVVVVGAGIQGAAVAREAAVRGLTVLLVDARDVAAGTSSRSSRLVHGGLRYLRHGHLALVREALVERERLLRLCPHLVRPQPMLMPFFADGGGSRLLARIGTALYRLLAGGSTMPPPRGLSAAEAVGAFPGLRERGLRGALEFFDAVTQDARLTLANVLAAHGAGAHVATHCELTGAGVDGVKLHDRVGNADVEVRTRHVVNAAGPRADALRGRCSIGGRPTVRMSRGSHIVLAPRASDTALAAFLPDHRIQFVVPHADGTVCGTTEIDDELAGDETAPPQVDVDYLLEALAFLLEPPPRAADVAFAYCGWRSLPAVRGPAGALNREAFVLPEPIACGTLHTIVGGKLTTHRSLGERVVREVFGFREPSPTRWTPLPGGAGPREVDDPLWWRHGGRVRLLRALLREDGRWREPLCPHRPFLAVELVHALRHDGAVRFADVMLRRLVHSIGPCLQRACLQRAHDLFLRARVVVVDTDRESAITALIAEVRALCGEAASPDLRDRAAAR